MDELSKFFPYAGNFELIQCSDKIEFSSVLDIGLGRGGASFYFSLKNKKVTSLGIEIESYDIHPSVKNNSNIFLKETLFEDYVTDEKFDAILMSHVLEHTQNVGVFLEKAYSLLNDNGWLFIMVPPYKKNVVHGHISNGWNMGQLMYNLLASGFNIKKGHFISYGYNICAFVQKYNKKPDILFSYHGNLLTERKYWPIEIYHGFNGNIESVNWFEDFQPKKYYYSPSLKQEYDYLISFYNFCQNLDKTRQYILYGYGSVGKLIYSQLKNNIIGIVDDNIKNLKIINIDGRDVNIIQLKDITKNDYVIISPFLYKNDILNSLNCIPTIYSM